MCSVSTLKDDGKKSTADAVLDKKAAKALKAQQGTVSHNGDKSETYIVDENEC